MSGARWLTGGIEPDILTPETLTEEQQLIARTAGDFLNQELVPAVERLEQKDWSLARALLRRCGELGLLGAEVPEAFGGEGLDKTTAVVISEAIGAAASFSVAFGAQTTLAMTPILWFGTESQKRLYLPRLASGELVGAYALSETGSGSDALAARTRATRAPDGSWRLTGEKMWISNAGFADLFVVFAKIDGERFSAFLVERGFPGVSIGREEHKMGLHGSSTAPLILQDAIVPPGQLLGEPGKGHAIAFNVLNLGRIKLAAMCSGCAKTAIGEAARYAAARRQFDQPIAAFGAIRHKLAEMTVREFGVESALYRVTGTIDATSADAPAEALRGHAVEASLLKVAGSEMLDFVLDENVQIHGGNGYVRDYPAERRYRDARVNRIFEGTNEINRLLVPTLLLKDDRLRRDGLQPAQGPAESPDGARRNVTDDTARHVAALKESALRLMDAVARTCGEAPAREQEVLMLLSDVIGEAFAAESAWLRAERAGGGLHAEAAAVIAHDGCLRAHAHALTAFAAMPPDETLAAERARLHALLTPAPVNTVAARRRLADAVLQRQGYPFARG